jgi:hypothetical protein
MPKVRSALSVLASCLAIAAPAAAEGVLYFLDDYVSPELWTLDTNDGTFLDDKDITGEESLFGGLAFGEDGRLYSIDGYNDGDSDRLFRIDPATGAGEVVGETGFNWNFRSLTLDPTTGTLYAATDNNLFTVDTGTGAATLVGSITGATLDQLTAIVIDASGNAYITDIGDTGLFSVDLATGQATHLGNLGQSGNWFDDLAFDAAGTLWGSRVSGGLYTIDIKALDTTLKFNGFYRGLAFADDTGECYADCTGEGDLDFFDFLCFQNAFADGDAYADCTGEGDFDFFDFLCFQNAFADGC